MILTIDAGNSNIVIGVWQGKELLYVNRVATERNKTGDSYAIEIKSLLSLNNISFETIDDAIISSVVPQITGALAQACEKLTAKRPLIVGPGVKTGLNILIDNPAQLGSDMVVDAVAVLTNYDKPVIIIDMGTATKIFAVDSKGNFLGCAIMPGIRLGLDALAERTAALPQVSLEPPTNVIGRNTDDSMKSGAVYGTASMIDGMIKRFEENLGQTAVVVATGGFSGEIVPHCRHTVLHDPDLMLKGLFKIYLKNRPLN